MTQTNRTVLFTLLLCFQTLFQVFAQNTSPCSREEYRQFDFWLGTWDVKMPDGKLAGSNTIRRELNDCIIHEHYTTKGGFEGFSYNTFNVQTNTWHQTWVDNGGMLLLLEGKFNGKSMVLSGEGKTPDGTLIQHRITWTPSQEGTVRQHWQMSKDKGARWDTLFDGTYHKSQHKPQDSSNDL